MHVVFVANLTRPSDIEAPALAAPLGLSEYDVRLALAVPPPTILLSTTDRDRAQSAVAAVRARGHTAHAFDDVSFTASEEMTGFDYFQLDVEGVRRFADGALLPYGDVYAILRAIHFSTEENDRARWRGGSSMPTFATRAHEKVTLVSKLEERENVAYFFRRSGERPWILRERHTNFAGLGGDLQPVAFSNFVRTVTRLREASPMAIFDDRLLRRRVAQRVTVDAQLKSSREGMDLLAHLLAMAIASQGGSPYR